MGLSIEYKNGQTPLDEDEKEGLLIKSIGTKKELDEFEQNNIEKAVVWSLKRSFDSNSLFKEAMIKRIHNEMFGNVWEWAGQFRKTNKNLGVDKLQIAIETRKLIDDTKFWINEKTFLPDEIAIRFKHRLVSIHCFPNGNGRHSRLMADIIIEKIFMLPVFTWGAGNSGTVSNVRLLYLTALKNADKGNYKSLIDFARS